MAGAPRDKPVKFAAPYRRRYCVDSPGTIPCVHGGLTTLTGGTRIAGGGRNRPQREDYAVMTLGDAGSRHEPSDRTAPSPSAAAGGASAVPILEMRHIAKRFGATQALE